MPASRACIAVAGCLALATLALPSPAAAADCAATAKLTPWPTESWATAKPTSGPDTMAAFTNYAFPEDLPNATPSELHTDALLVARGGTIVYERYANGFRVDTAAHGWGITYSIVQALYGRVVLEKHLSIDTPAGRLLPALDTPDKQAITLHQLLTMTSGLRFDDRFEYAPFGSTLLSMLYTRGHHDMGSYAASQPLDYPPGTHWSLGSGDPMILMAALRPLVGEAAYGDYPWTALFDPLGMRSVTWERDGVGSFVGSDYLYATPRDFARLGLLYLMNGCWGDQQLLPDGWVKLAGTPAPPLLGDNGGGRKASFGALWWLNVPLTQGASPPMTTAPQDTLSALGRNGQRLYVIPSLGLVIVRIADDEDRSFSDATFLQLAIKAFASRGRSS
jgi:CubicO group peptidase (beta-lactamase class C family)